MITFEQFEEEFLDLMMNERLSIYDSYCEENDIENSIHENDSSNLEVYFGDIKDAIEAALLGDYRIDDDYFKIDGYGHLASFDRHEVMEQINDRLKDIYECPEYWRTYIDPQDDSDDE